VVFERARCLSRWALKLLRVGALTVEGARLFQVDATLSFRKFLRAGQLDIWTKRRFLSPLIALTGPSWKLRFLMRLTSLVALLWMFSIILTSARLCGFQAEVAYSR